MLLPADSGFEGPFPDLTRRLRLGVIGAGRIAKTQAQAARLTDRWELVAGVLSSDAGKSSARAAEWRLPEERCYDSVPEMLAGEAAREDGIDAVIIASPNDQHFAAASACLAANMDLLCEKPLTNKLDEAEQLEKTASDNGQVFGVCYVMSCFAMIRQAREIVQSGGIGRINQIHVEFMQDWMTPEDAGEAAHIKWRLDPKISGPTSCTDDIATHAAHLASFVSGLKMTGLRADMHICGAPKQLEDTVFMTTAYEQDVPGTLMATRLAPGNRGGLRLRIFGSEGGVEWDLEHSEYLKWARFGEPDRILSRGQGHGIAPPVERLVRTGRGFPEGLIEAWANLYTEFALAIAARRDGRQTPDGWLALPRVADGADGVRFIEAAVRSHNRGGVWETL